MHPNKTSRLLYELGENARITTKQLGKVLNMSQQAVSYTIQHLKEKGIIQNYQTVVDPAKLGLMNVIVLYTYSRFGNAGNIKRSLHSNPHATRIEEVSQGADLLVEYCVPNLSFFNKQHKEFLYGFKDSLKIKETYVVIVKHHYNKSYLNPRAEAKEHVISGDRDINKLTREQGKVLDGLMKNARESITSIANQLGKDPKTAVRIKKDLERQSIIRKYSIVINHQAASINRRHLLLNLDYEDQEDEKRLLEYCKQHKNITVLTKTLGPYDIIITVEKHENQKPVINDIRKQFRVADYRIMDADSTLKYDFLPGNILEP